MIKINVLCRHTLTFKITKYYYY